MNNSFLIKYLLLIFIMTLTCFISYKIIDKITNNKSNSIATLEKKYEEKVIIDYNSNYELKEYYNNNNLDKKIVNLSNCLHSYISIQKDSNSNINNIVKELEEYYNSDNKNFAFYYLDLNTGFSISYNENQPIFGASVLKAPFIIYLYKQASLGKIDLEEELTYEKEFYSGGSGILQSETPGGKYTVRELCYLTITQSDNIAYRILANRFGINNAKSFWNELGVNSIYHYNVLFSDINAKDAAYIMKYLYEFSLEDNEYAKELINTFTNALYNFIPKDGLTMAHKSGWANTSIHDMSIKFDDNPYILIIFSKRGETEFQSLFDFTSEKISQIHDIFWNENIDYCLNEFNDN